MRDRQQRCSCGDAEFFEKGPHVGTNSIVVLVDQRGDGRLGGRGRES